MRPDLSSTGPASGICLALEVAYRHWPGSCLSRQHAAIVAKWWWLWRHQVAMKGAAASPEADPERRAELEGGRWNPQLAAPAGLEAPHPPRQSWQVLQPDHAARPHAAAGRAAPVCARSCHCCVPASAAAAGVVACTSSRRWVPSALQCCYLWQPIGLRAGSAVLLHNC